VTHRALIGMRSVVPGLWNPLAYIAGGGIALRWFRDQFFRPGDGDPTVGDMYDVMTARAAKIPPGADGLYFSPHLGGRICPASPAMRGAWVGFSWGHTQDHFFRAVLESIAFEYSYYLSILRELIPGLSLTEARVIGGGARSGQWNQIKADVLDVPYQRLSRSEFATWGGAMIAGRAVGLFDDLAETALTSTGRQGDSLKPRPENVAQYKGMAEQYARWQSVLAETF
jgi:xylulokinase